MKNKFPFIMSMITILILINLSGCCRIEENLSVNDSNISSGNFCLPLLFPAGYQPGEGRQTDLADIDSPPTSWRLISNLPDSYNFKLDEISAVIDVADSKSVMLPVYPSTLLMFSFGKGVWEEINLGVDNEYRIVESTQSFWLFDKNAESRIKLFAFNAGSNNFTEFSIPHSLEINSLEQITFDGNIFWGVFIDVNGDRLVGQFSLEDQELKPENIFDPFLFSDSEKVVSFDSVTSPISLIIDSKGDAILSTTDRSSKKVTVWSIDKDGNLDLITKFENRLSPNDYPYDGVGIFLDENDNLWAGDLLWLDGMNKDDVFTMYRSPIFITTRPNPRADVVWSKPNPVADTSDGRIWFQSLRGTAWFQPETGEWCMFSSSQSNIVKDSDGNLWMVYDNALYMLPASETSKQE